MADLPETGTFKINTVGPLKEGTSKKTGRPYKVYDLQLGADPQWYGTFWTKDEDPEEGMELKGTKSYDSEFDNYKFEMERQGGKSNWNPAGANATVMVATAQIISGFLSLGDHYELWEKSDPKLKAKFDKYFDTVVAASKRVKEQTVSMGSLKPEEQTGESKSSDGDPGPVNIPPDLQSVPGEESVDL